MKWLKVVFHTEWSKSERKNQILYFNTYIWNLEKWYWWIYLQGRSGDADVENEYVETMGEGEGRIYRESSITSGNLLCNTGSPAWCFLSISRGRMGGGEGGSKGRVYVYMCVCVCVCVCIYIYIYMYNYDSFSLCMASTLWWKPAHCKGIILQIKKLIFLNLTKEWF